ncbi:hypothetical protein ACRTDJ_19110 [Shewanella algae]
MFKKVIFGLSAAAIMCSISGCGDSAAEITMENVERISKTSALSDAGLISFQQNLAQCNKDNSCQSKAIYEMYESAFSEAGFSQIETAIKYKEKTEELAKMTPTMNSQKLLINWGQALIGVYSCLDNSSCKEWLLETGRVSESDLGKLTPSA